MLNNKGQSLVLFILIIPMLIGIAALVIDVGNAYNQKNEMNNAIELVLEYGLTSKQPSETQETIQEELTSPKEEKKKDILPIFPKFVIHLLFFTKKY